MTQQSTDGRVLRSERNRLLIIDAMIELVYEGVYMPTAQQVADKANIAIRTIFRHFSEMDQLYAEVDERMFVRYIELFSGGKRTGTLQERIKNSINRHAKAYTEITPIALGTMSQLWRSKQVKKSYFAHQKRLRADLEDWMPELLQVDPNHREAIYGLISFDYLYRLRVVQGMSRKATVDLIIELVSDIFAKNNIPALS